MRRKLNAYLNLWRTIPAYWFYKKNRLHERCRKDLEQWGLHLMEATELPELLKFSYCLANEKPCRNIFLHRLHRNPVMFAVTRCLFKPMEHCYLSMPPEAIGGGFSYQHGFSTIVSARSIGENCRIFQQVTVGYNGDQAPVIGDNVEIMAGALVIGGITLGDNCRVAAGAVVVHDVPENATVAGCPAKVIRIEVET